MHATSPADRTDRAAGVDWGLDVLTIALIVWWLVRLAGFAHAAILQSDECFHAGVAEWIAVHGRLPRELPGLYSGFRYFYPPLFHVIGAGWVVLLGRGSLAQLNVVVTGAAAVAAWLAGRELGGRGAARAAALLVVTSPGIGQYAARFYVEALSTLLALVVLLALARLDRRERLRDALALGFATGLAWLAKPSALVFPALWLALALLAAWRGRGWLARRLGLATGVAMVVAAPYWLRDWILFGSPLYPVGAADRHALVDRLNQTTYSLAPLEFARQLVAASGPWIPLAAVIGALATWRRPGSRRYAVAIVLGAAALALAPLQPMVEPRHLHPVLAMLAVLGAAAVTRVLAPRRALALGLAALVLGAAAWSIARLPNPRPEFDPDPAVVVANAAIGRVVPAGDAVLSLWTYDTWYHARRDATWPIPWGQREHPIEMFTTGDCDSVAAAFARHRIGWALVPADAAGDSSFDAANYPASLLRCLRSLEHEGRARIAWASDDLELVRVGR